MLWQRLEPFQSRVGHIDPTYYLGRIRTPGSPSSSEVQRIAQIVSDVQKDIADYDQDILFLENLVLGLKKKKDELFQYMSICKSYTAPIRRLPPEILAEVFLKYRDSFSNHNDFGYLVPVDSTSSLLALGLVCKLWHTVTLSCPQLWSHFDLTLTSFRNARSTHQKLAHCLSRSAQSPLSFRLYIDDSNLVKEGWQVSEFFRIMEVLVGQCHRWSHAVLNSVSDRGLFTSPLKVKRALPLMEALDLRGTAIQQLLNQTSIFTGVYSLRTLVVSRLSLDIFWANLDTSQLRHLHICHWTSDCSVLAQLAGSCPYLRSLILDPEFNPLEPCAHSHKTRFEKLEDLTLKGMSWYDINETLSALTLPSLRKLSLCSSVKGVENDYEHADQAKPQNAVASFFSRSNCPLSIFEIREPWHIFPYSLHIIHAILRSATSLTEVFLSELWPPFIDSSFLRFLYLPITDSDSGIRPNVSDSSKNNQKPRSFDETWLERNLQSKVVLPNLRKLKLTVDADKEDFDESSLVEMIKSRRVSNDSKIYHSRCLQSLELVLRGKNVEESMIQRLRSLQNAGTIVVVTIKPLDH